MRPYSIPEKLKPLTEAQFAQLHTWLDTDPYGQIREKLRTEFGIDISTATICRYSQNRDLARHLTEKEEDATAIHDFLNIMNGQPVPYDDAGIELVMKRAFGLATAREITPAKLATLLRVFHYRKNCAWTERRLTQNDQRIAISGRIARVKEQQLSSHPNRNRNPNLLPASEKFTLWTAEDIVHNQPKVEAAIRNDPLLSQIGLPPDEPPNPTPNLNPTLPGSSRGHETPNDSSAPSSQTLSESSSESSPNPAQLIPVISGAPNRAIPLKPTIDQLHGAASHI